MDSPIINNWVSPLSFLGVLRVFLLSHFSMKFLCANRISPDWTPRSAASHLGLCCLPMSHKKDAGLNELNAFHNPSILGIGPFPPAIQDA